LAELINVDKVCFGILELGKLDYASKDFSPRILDESEELGIISL